MAVLSLDQFGKNTVNSGLFTADELKTLWNALPADGRPKSGDEFAARLVASGKLNQFQADELLSNRNTPLVLGDYVLLGKIGAGGMGQVFKARHRVMERMVAVKLLPSAMTKDEAAIKRFQREVKAAAKLSHPNIVQAFDASAQRGVWYLVMEHVEGQDLAAFVKQRGPLSVEQAVDYTVQAARGLAFAHAEGVIHRDIKPANLLLDKKGVVKILDMGLARIDDGSDGLTGTEQVMGTVDYMSPEQAANTKGVDARADIYSLGCTLWYLLTGKKAYEGETMIERLMAHREQPFPSLVKTRDDVPWPLEQAFHKMLAKRPQDRTQTMDEVIAALELFSGSSTKGGMGSSIGMSSTQNPELASFLQTIGPKASGPGTMATGARTATAPKSTNVAPVEVTMAFAAAEVGTDPQSEMLVKRATAPSPAKLKPRGGGKGKQPPVKLIAAGFLFLLLGVILVIKNDKGEPVAEVKLPAGNTIEVKPPAGGSVQVRPDDTATVSFPPKIDDRGALSTTPAPLPVTTGNYALDFSNLPAAPSSSPVGVLLPSLGVKPGRPLTIEMFVTPLEYPKESTVNSPLLSIGPFQLKQYSQSSASKYIWNCTWEDANKQLKILGLGEWTARRSNHIAVVSTSKQIRLFLDGRLLSTTEINEPPRSDVLGTGIGKFSSNGDWRPFLGLIDEVRISKIARYNQGYTPQARLEADEDTIALYHFDEGTGDVLHDSSGNGHDGKIIGAEWVRAEGGSIAAPTRTDLLKNLDVVANAVAGKFALDGEGLRVTDGDLQARIELPVEPMPAEYDLHVAVGRIAPGGKAFVVGVPWQGSQGCVVVDGFSNPPLSGLELIDGQTPKVNGTESPGEKITFGPRNHKVVVRVRNQGIAAECDGKPLFDWKGKPSQFSTHPMWAVPRKDLPFVGFQGPYVVHGVELLPFVAKPTVTPAAATGLPIIPAPTTAKASERSILSSTPESSVVTIDVLAQLDTTKDRFFNTQLIHANQWTLTNGKLTYVSDGHSGKIASPIDLSEANDYEIVVDVRRLTGNSVFTLDFSPAKSKWSGLDVYIGGRIELKAENGTRKKIGDWPAKSVGGGRLSMRVRREQGDRPGQIGVTVDGEKAAEWTGMLAQIGNSPEEEHPDFPKHPCIGIFCFKDSYEFASWQVRILDGQVLSPRYNQGRIGPAPPLAKAPFDAAQAKAHQQAWAKHLGMQVETVNSTGAKLSLIPPGEFLMGSTDEQVEAALKVAEAIKADQRIKDRIQKNERPQHRVIITKPFLMGATEVTVGQFRKFSATGYQTGAEKAEIAAKAAGVPATVPPKPIPTYLRPGYAVTDDSPAAFISWNDAVAYCRWLSDQEQTVYRLPTEAEWEYACRAGTTTQYSFGDDLSLLDQVSWYQKNAGGIVHPVGTKLPNGFGLFDIHGNMEEWCRDFYDERWYEKTSVNDPHGPTTGSYPVIRGGSWKSTASDGRSASRIPDHSPSNRFESTGFRIVRELAAPSTTASVTPQPAVPAAASDKLFMHDPAFPQWVKDVQAMPAEEQIEAVSKKLVELNPGFDGKVTGGDGTGPSKFENGVVTEWGIVTENITDISPLRALSGLRQLVCSGSRSRESPLTDLTPLQGLKLTHLSFQYTQVSDLSPLKGMPLSYLHFGGTQVLDLSPLQGMPLKQMSFGETQVSDLSPLAGMKLDKLAFTGTKVSDLSAVRGMPLIYGLECGHTQVFDLSPLHDCKTLGRVDAVYTKVTAASVAALQKAVPNCKIVWDDPAKSTTPKPPVVKPTLVKSAASGTK